MHRAPNPERDFGEAVKHVGFTAESRGRWLLTIAALPPFDELPAPKQAALKMDMQAFLDPGGAAGKLADPFVAHWHRRIHLGVSKLERGLAWSTRLSTHVGFWVPLDRQTKGAEFRFGRTKGYMEPREADLLQSNDGGTKKDQMSHLIVEVLLELERERKLRRCPRCGHLFVPNRRQLLLLQAVRLARPHSEAPWQSSASHTLICSGMCRTRADGYVRKLRSAYLTDFTPYN
jgi:hypothetical protein